MPRKPPGPAPGPPTTPVIIRFPPELLRALTWHAKRLRVTRTALVIEMLLSSLEIERQK